MSSADDSKRMRLKGPWRNDDGRAHHVRRKIRRFILSAVLSLGLFVFGLWLTEPFQTPQTHILSAFATFDPQQTYGTRFTPTDEHAWQELSRIHNTNETSPFLLTLENLQRHVAQVAERCSLRDRVVLNISSHGIAIDGEAYLLADEFQPAFEDTLLISVRDILIALRDIPCETKLIAIDGGSILCDDRLGAAVNDYPSCLANVVSEMADASMCVLTSHGDGELSELSYRLGQSVFAHFVQRALFGEADADRNRIVDFQELHRFVAESTRAFVATESGGQTSQNPMLLRGDAFREANVALPVSSIAKPPSKLLERELAWTARFSAAKSGSAVVPPDKKGPPSAENASDGDREILSPIVSESQQLAQLVAQAWVLRDALRKDERVADVPHLFRAFEESLVGCEQACRIGTLDQIRAARQHLKAELFYWQQPVTSANSIQPLPEGAYTLRNVAEPADNEPIAKKFADLVAALKTKDFQKWVNSNWNDDLDRLYEARIVPQLLAAGIDDGEVVSQVVRLRRLAVKAGDDRPSARDLQNADSLRLAAEQLLIQKSSVDWERKAAEALSVAQDEYNAAISHADRRQYAEHARAMATINAGRLFRWFTLVRGQASIWCPSLSQLLDYVDNVTQLSDELASDDSETAARLVRDLARSDQRIASMLVDDAQRLLGKAGSVTEGRTLLIEKLLATSLPSAGLRAQLLNELEQNYRSKDLPLPHDEFASMQDNVQQDALSLLQIQLRLARLSSLPNTELRRRIDKAIKSLDSNDSSQSVADASTELKRIHYSIREQIPVLSTKLTALSSDECSTATLRLTRILETIDHRDAPTFSDISLQPTHARLAEFRQLQQRESRFRYFRDYAFQDIAYLTAASQQFKSRSNQLFPHSDDEATASVVQIAAPDEISLAESSEQRFDVGVDTEKDVPVWLVAEYDTSMVSVESAEDHPVYDSGQLQLQNVDRYAALKTLPVTAQSKAQGSTTLPLTIRHKSTSQASTQITLTAVTPQEVIRKSLQVELPGSGTLAVVADGERGTWVEQDTHVILQPLPNRTQTYDLGIRNRGKDTETVDVSVFALPAAIAMPKGALAIADASSHLVNLQQNLIASLHDLELRPAAVTKIPFPKLAPPKKGEATELHQNIEHGLVVAISNRATDRVSFHRIAIAPQRPRRYVEPRVTFDARLRRLRVEVLARNTDGIPKSGFRVAAELADMPAAERKGKLSGVIKPASPTALLDVQLPRGIPRPQRLYLHVDGYPRAFIYDVSPIQRDGPVSETIDLMSVTVASPNTLLALNSQQKSVPVKVRVDSPLGAFSNSQDKLVVGLDVGQDRGLEGDPKVELRADRQVRATVNSLGPNGLFVVDTVVSDHEFELPIETATNCRADILCRLKVDNHVAHGTSAASVYLDSIAPRIISVDFPLANSVAQGVPMHAVVHVTDDDLSGVEKIEAAFDVDRAGQFTADMKLTPAVRKDGDGWHLHVPTKGFELGAYSLLIRATDRAGNQSAYKRVTVEVSDEASPSAFNIVRGKIAFGQLPAGGFKVTLNSSEKKPPAAGVLEVQTNAKGEFVFPKVPVGMYELSARGLLKNMNLSGAKPITVVKPPGKPTEASIAVGLRD